MRITSIAVTLYLFVAAPLAQAQAGEVSLKGTEVVPGITMLEGVGGFVGGNMAIISGDDAVVLIDDGLETISEMLLKAINEHSDRPVDYVFNTHYHGDHLGSNKALHMSGATVVAHDNIRKRLLDAGWRTADGMRPAEAGELPQITFSDEMTFHLNDLTAHLIHVPSAHTDGDGFIYFPGVNVIHTGDLLFYGMFPYIDIDGGGSVDGYIAALKKIAELADSSTKIIPGHGPLTDVSGVQASIDMLEDANARVGKLVAAGKSEDEIVAANPLAHLHDEWNWQFITTEVMTRTLYRANAK